MGVVYRAWDRRLERHVAVKMATELDEIAAERLEREARSLARISHPSLVSVFDIGRDEAGQPFLVMELLEGESLARHLETHTYSQAGAVELMLPVLEGLAHCHEAGLVHRDVKPENLIVVRDGTSRPRLKLVDFGIAKRTDLASDLTFGVIGTPDYMAPEQLQPRAVVGPAVDVWSSCVCIYVMATGQRPFEGESLAELFQAIAHAPLPYPRHADMDGALFAILAHGTRKNAADRPSSMRVLLAALEAWLERAKADTRAAPASRSRPDAETVSSPVPIETVDPSTTAPPPTSTLDAAIRRSFRGTK
jgi:serine/threonine-protein kinase